MSAELFFGIVIGATIGNIAGYFAAELIKRAFR